MLLQAVEEKHSNKISYPRVERGKSILMPEYNSFNDPHLQHYYRNKFQAQNCKKKALTVCNQNAHQIIGIPYVFGSVPFELHFI